MIFERCDLEIICYNLEIKNSKAIKNITFYK